MKNILKVCLVVAVMAMSMTACQDEFESGDLIISTTDNVLKNGDGDDGSNQNPPPPPPTGD